MLTGPDIVGPLEQPLFAYNGSTSVRDVLIAGLRWPTEYWVKLAVSWIAQGAATDREILAMLRIQDRGGQGGNRS
jgi:hypothetical protein